MPDEVTLDVTTIEENVTVETTAGDVVGIQVVAPTGPAGATGPAGPNSVTSATTSDGTGQIMLDTLAVGICNILDEVVFDTLTYTFAEGSAQALKDALDISFADISDAQTGTADLILENLTATNIGSGTASIGSALIVGDGDSVKGRYDIFGNTSHFQWYSDSALYGERSFTITTENLTSSGSYVYKYPVGNGTLALTANANGEPDKLTAGTISGATTFNATSYTYGTGAAAAHRTALGLTTLATTTPGTNVATFLESPTSANLASALTDENGTGGGFVRAEGATLTTPTLVGTPVFNATAYTYGTGAAEAHRTALELDTLFNAKANLAGGNTLTGVQRIDGDISSNGAAITNTAMSMRSTSGQQYVSRFIGQNSAYAGFAVVATNAASKPFVQFGAGSETAANFSLVQDSTSALSFRGGNVVGGALLTITSNTNIGINNAAPNAAALLDLTSTTKGFLPPRMTLVQRTAIASPPAGLMIYNTTSNKLNVYNGTAWEVITSL